MRRLSINEVPMLRTSERATFKRCQQMWHYGWNQGLEKNGTPDKPLWMGTGLHLALAKWYCGPGTTRGPHPAETWEEYAADAIETVRVPGLSDDAEDIYVSAKELGTEMMDGYVRKYGRDEHMYIIQPEQTFDLEVPWPKYPEGHLLKALADRRAMLIKYVGTYDLVYRDLVSDQIWMEEHKSAAAISTAHLSLDDQGGSYWATASRALRARELIGPKESLRGIEYNFLRKGLPDPRPRNHDGAYTNKAGKKHFWEALDGAGISYRKAANLAELSALAEQAGLEVIGDVSKRQPQPLFVRERIHRTSKERASQLRRIQHEAVQIELVRSGIVPPSKTPTRDCARFCQFFDLCELDERGGDTKTFAKTVYHRRDVYADHRKSTDG